MILFIAAACIAAKRKGFRVGVLLTEWSMIPLYGTELLLVAAQVAAWQKVYDFLPYASWLQSAFLLSLLFPIFRFRLYGQACIGAGMTILGTILNKIAMHANGGRMPVFPTLSRLTGYYQDGALRAAGDTVHCLMTSQTRLNGLGDWIDVGFSIMSVGDALIHGFVLLIVYSVIVEKNKGDDKDG